MPRQNFYAVLPLLLAARTLSRGMTIKRIILLSDGTGNSSAKVWRTNVWRMFEALDLRDSDQVAIYDDGVGTSGFKPLAMLGGAFGYGLKRNVLDLYKFACRNYSGPQDEIFAFGFSRGAFTIRIVNGLILNQGLVTADGERELERLARAAYRAYRGERFHTIWHVEKPFRRLRDIFLSLWHWSKPPYEKAHNRQVAHIRFLGLWDTVAAYGLPIDVLTTGISRWLWPLELPDQNLSPRVQRACHALALDDERTTFHPVLWNERREETNNGVPDRPAFTKDEHISQVWFAGAHSNVGGGYPEDSLALIPFSWMLNEARHCGLRFKLSSNTLAQEGELAEPDALKQALMGMDKDGRLYNPRAGLGGYYRYGPRRLDQLCNDQGAGRERDEVFIARPKIHRTAFSRITSGARDYAPIGIPAVYDVAMEDGSIAAPQEVGLETLQKSADRVRGAEVVWNYVWAMRVLYFATVGLTLALLSYPLWGSPSPSGDAESRIRWVSDLVDLIGSFLPNFASNWTTTFRRAPHVLVSFAAGIGILLFVNNRLAAQSADLMRVLWLRPESVTRGTDAGLHKCIFRFRTANWYVSGIRWLKYWIMPTSFAVLTAYLCLAVGSHLVFNVLDTAGLVCRNSHVLSTIAVGQKHEVVLTTAELCRPTGIRVDRGQRYVAQVDVLEAWRDGEITTGIGGFFTLDAPSLWHGMKLVLATPLRRNITRPWFRILARYGDTGGEQVSLDPDPNLDDEENARVLSAYMRPTRSGELFFYVNDAVTGVPGMYGLFYRNNIGSAKITLQRTR